MGQRYNKDSCMLVSNLFPNFSVEFFLTLVFFRLFSCFKQAPRITPANRIIKPKPKRRPTRHQFRQGIHLHPPPNRRIIAPKSRHIQLQLRDVLDAIEFIPILRHHPHKTLEKLTSQL